MSGPRETIVTTPQGPMRVWRKGTGKRIGVFAGFAGQPRWSPFLDALAERRQVVAPSLPGFPGGPRADGLDSHLDWIVAARDAFVAADLIGADLVGASVGAALAAEVAALWPNDVRSLTLMAPYGLFDESEPVADVFAQPPGGFAAAVSSKPKEFEAFLAPPEGADKGEWEVSALRARVAAAAITWPLGDTGLARRLARIVAPTLLVWGDEDRIVPPGYSRRFGKAIAGKTRYKTIRRAGHVVEHDQPQQVAAAILAFVEASGR
jgi:pimeloyl-ACP methyl ester carboxylesterase